MKTNRPQTVYRLSVTGRTRFLEYIAELERVVGDAAKAVPVKAKGGLVSG
jgi:hypothetical protein